MGLYDLEEYDHIYVTVRRDKLKDLKVCYEQFGWEEVECQEHKVYDNLLDMTFRRPHKIADKDELQLLQVHLEEALNAVGKYEKAPKRKTRAFVSCLGVLAFLLLAIGLPLGIVSGTASYKVIGYVMAAAGVIIIPMVSVFGVKLWRYENRTYERRLKISRELVIGICHNAVLVRQRGTEALVESAEPIREMMHGIARKARTEEQGEEMLADIMDAGIRKAMEERRAGAAHAAGDLAGTAKEDAGNVVVVPAGDSVVIVETEPADGQAAAAKEAKDE
ncbi:MAG: hypothetical protein LUE27_07865 [Clostridia bacterium]|nr:hypothetical protein [Clostridia bacterium]